jgi:hypothetical protein
MIPASADAQCMAAELRDFHARVVRIHEAILDGEQGFVEHAVDDLSADMWAVIEGREGLPSGA